MNTVSGCGHDITISNMQCIHGTLLCLPANDPKIAVLGPIGQRGRAIEDRAFRPDKGLTGFRCDRNAAINARLKKEGDPNRGSSYDG